MKIIQDLPSEIVNNWNVHFKLYECPLCQTHFKANVADIKRLRKKNCGCKRTLPTLPNVINGMSVIKDLGTIKSRRFAIFKCELCENGFKANVSDINCNKVKRHCGCYKKPLKEIIVKIKAIKPLTITEIVAKNLNISVKESELLRYTYGGMKQRCYNENHFKYKNYGARGISVCDRWLKSFIDFANDMGAKSSADLSIDRIDNEGNYEPSNCRWATQLIQQNNKRN